MKTADSRALAVARAVVEKHDPELVILFGSRSRGGLPLELGRGPHAHHQCGASRTDRRAGAAAA